MVRKKVLIRKKDNKIIDAGRIESPKIPTDPEVADEFSEASRSAGSGADLLAEKLRQHTSSTPEITANDIDAAWEQDDIGDEAVGGDNMTPDQSVVEEIGEAVGIKYDDGEPLRTSVEEKSPGRSRISAEEDRKQRPRDKEDNTTPGTHEPGDWGE